MELINAIENRRSIRKYIDKPVDETILMELIDAARLCQSGKNRQPWLFKILKGEEKDKLSYLLLAQLEKAESELPGWAAWVNYSSDIIRQAPVLILIFREKNEYWKTSDLLSIGAAAEHICLRATDLGLGSLWLRDTDVADKEISSFIGHPELELVSGIAIGYADEHPGPRPRKDLKNIIL